MIFVFESNRAGTHGKGAALYAKTHYGAEPGRGSGRTGNSYAIVTKDRRFRSYPIYMIERYVSDFIEYAKNNPHLKFLVTRVGCEGAGYTDEQMAPCFEGAPDNCELPFEWVSIIKKLKETRASLAAAMDIRDRVRLRENPAVATLFDNIDRTIRTEIETTRFTNHMWTNIDNIQVVTLPTVPEDLITWSNTDETGTAES